ncbi:mechanosensitive ion channel family protein [Sunxiuqinia elliptica]|uniref:Small conductance mechanosensitive channel n=1 Tax=Sunxiuqinia elliptica TaxID=655355 RepID=A0A4R6H1P0_9BACT|nr:mechanosensitive ion channel domain-containing protein [Sunxiuqinia elliptica]TDO01166.1 small conductance mechanosensitive channel [Sunxiuqinia elliptica]TDO57677.1 small conductance mechanosensitive channel [Sunxiuqinia elliptica]
MEYLEKGSDWISQMAIQYGMKLVAAIITLVIGLWVINMLTNAINKFMDRRNIDVSLRGFLKGMFNILLKVMLVISVIGMLGIEMTSFIAILGAAGLAVGMALSGTLQNFAGGVIILIIKPFKVGDYIEAQGYAGTVSEIQIFNTVLKTPDNVTIVIPNGGLSTGSVKNYSTEARRRVDFVFGIAYGDNYDQAKDLIVRLANDDSRILKDPAPFIVLSELADSSVNITVRVWCNAADYWAIKFDLTERVYKEFPKDGLNIPFPQMDVHVHQ